MTYYVKSPNTTRRVFSIMCRDKGRVSTVRSKDIDAINDRYKAGEAFDICRQAVVALKDSYLLKAKAALINTNLHVVSRYFANRTTHHLTDPYAAKRELIRAAEACGQHSLDLTTREALQIHVDTAYRGRKHRRLVAGVNRLLRFLGKPWRLQAVKLKHVEPAGITLAVFMERLPHIHDPYRTFLATLFATGARLGEAMAIRQYKGGEDVWIAQQLDKDLEYRETKTGAVRNAVVVPELKGYVEEWAKVSEETRKALRTAKWATIARRELGLRAHDLRHCYAKRLGEMGCDIKEIAENLGIGEGVALRHYKGIVQSVHRVSMVARKLRGQ